MASLPKRSLRASAVICTAVVLAVMVPYPLFSDFTGKSWPFYKPIVLPQGLSGESLVEVSPDPAVFAETTQTHSDLRIIEADSQLEAPYKLLVGRGKELRESIAATMQNVSHIPGEHTSFVLDFGKGVVLHNEIEIITSSMNFQRNVTVEESSDREHWEMLEGKGQISALSIPEHDFSTRNTHVEYPYSTARYVRVRVINQGELPLQITGAIGYSIQKLPPIQTEFPTESVQLKENPEGSNTLIVLDLGNKGLPTSQLTVATPKENFYREVRVQGSNDLENWTTVKNIDVIYSYNSPAFSRNKLFVNYPEVLFRYIRLTVFNKDDTPLTIDEVNIYGFSRKLIFMASPDSTYLLYYGNPKVSAPSYELERLFPYLVTENLPAVQLGDEIPNPSYVRPKVPFTERYPWLLPATVGVAAILIGLFLVRLLRQLRTPMPPTTAPE